ncbi:uncharacterized protein C8Q71DRAFT_57011 [Rhodofomes roseus]|uniref:Uncharacterized protein n=1 Tax=Rhodofomes roseus TaxID=34475 RepID=A0ABQ8KG21_9APHY|nr:uncharacterized protein C8Q71DRAFT_57011 [Rhodofomes roseus]KAH9836741.1 hypothetical protein C8Q71DRAFT_57011 [Rhodofomes roseus]
MFILLIPRSRASSNSLQCLTVCPAERRFSSPVSAIVPAGHAGMVDPGRSCAPLCAVAFWSPPIHTSPIKLLRMHVLQSIALGCPRCAFCRRTHDRPAPSTHMKQLPSACLYARRHDRRCYSVPISDDYVVDELTTIGPSLHHRDSLTDQPKRIPCTGKVSRITLVTAWSTHAGISQRDATSKPRNTVEVGKVQGEPRTMRGRTRHAAVAAKTAE